MSTICTRCPSSFAYLRLQLADEKTGREQAHALGQDVLREDVDERWQQDEGHSGLVDEEEGDKLGHGRLEHGLSHSVSIHYPHLHQLSSYHLLRSDLGLLVLARDEGRAGHSRWADSSGRAESGPREGAEEAGVHAGRSRVCRSARCCGSPIDRMELARGRITYRTRFSKPGEMTGDGVAGGSDLLVSLVVSAKARKLRPGKSRVTCKGLGGVKNTIRLPTSRYHQLQFQPTMRIN
jgi:hypothetical protein